MLMCLLLLLLYFHCLSGFCCMLLYSLCTWADLLPLTSCVDSNKITLKHVGYEISSFF